MGVRLWSFAKLMSDGIEVWPNNAFQPDGLAVPMLKNKRVFTILPAYQVVLCKAAAECWPLGRHHR
jgi:hypothetical protein